VLYWFLILVAFTCGLPNTDAERQSSEAPDLCGGIPMPVE
jgi:hypothetical protein